MIYDEDNDLFLPKKPFASWVLNKAEARWQSPSLTGDQSCFNSRTKFIENEARTHSWSYNWNESGQSWDIENSLA